MMSDCVEEAVLGILPGNIGRRPVEYNRPSARLLSSICVTTWPMVNTGRAHRPPILVLPTEGWVW